MGNGNRSKKEENFEYGIEYENQLICLEDSFKANRRNKRSKLLDSPRSKKKIKVHLNSEEDANGSDSTKFKPLTPFIDPDHNLSTLQMKQLSSRENLNLLKGLKKYTVFINILSCIHYGEMSTVYSVQISNNEEKESESSQKETLPSTTAIMKIFKPNKKYFKEEIRQIKINNEKHIKYCSKSPSHFFAENESSIIKKISKQICSESSDPQMKCLHLTSVISRFKNALILSPIYKLKEPISLPQNEETIQSLSKDIIADRSFEVESIQDSFAPRLDKIIKISGKTQRHLIAKKCQLLIAMMVETMLIFLPTLSTNNILWSGEEPVPVDFCRARFISPSEKSDKLTEAIAKLMSQIKY